MPHELLTLLFKSYRALLGDWRRNRVWIFVILTITLGSLLRVVWATHVSADSWGGFVAILSLTLVGLPLCVLRGRYGHSSLIDIALKRCNVPREILADTIVVTLQALALPLRAARIIPPLQFVLNRVLPHIAVLNRLVPTPR